MTKSRLVFQLKIVKKLCLEAQEAHLSRLGLSRADAARMTDPFEFEPGHYSMSLREYRSILGAEDAATYFGYETSAAKRDGAIASSFCLEFWPSLLWVVHVHPRSSVWEVGFQPKEGYARSLLESGSVDSGETTQSVVCSLADDHAEVESWNEWAIHTFRFGAKTYRGEFKYNMLEPWRIES